MLPRFNANTTLRAQFYPALLQAPQNPFQMLCHKKCWLSKRAKILARLRELFQMVLHSYSSLRLGRSGEGQSSTKVPVLRAAESYGNRHFSKQIKVKERDQIKSHAGSQSKLVMKPQSKSVVMPPDMWEVFGLAAEQDVGSECLAISKSSMTKSFWTGKLATSALVQPPQESG